MGQSPESARKHSRPYYSMSDHDEKLTCLYIGNIDKKVENDQLNEVFRQFGELEYCYLIYEPSSAERSSRDVKISRGYGFAKFVKYEDLLRAKQELDGYELQGRKLKIELSKRNKPREETPGRYLGRKRQGSPQGRRGGRSYSRSSSDDSYYERRRRHERKQRHRKRRERERDRSSEYFDRSRSKDRKQHRRRRSSSEDRDRDRRRDRG